MRIKITVYIISLLLSTNSFISAQEHLLNINEFQVSLKLGQCFMAYPQDSINKQATNFEIVKEQYETIEMPSELFLLQKGINVERDSSWRVKIAPASVRLVRRTRQAPCKKKRSFDFDYQNSLQICLVEIPARFLTIRKLQHTKGDSIAFSPKIIQLKKLLSLSSLKIFTNETVINPENNPTVFTLKGSAWSKWLNVGSFDCHTNPYEKIKIIQIALTKQGYSIEINGVFSDKMKKAIIDFQEKNGLPKGQLDIETIKKLGVEF